MKFNKIIKVAYISIIIMILLVMNNTAVLAATSQELYNEKNSILTKNRKSS